MPKIEIDLADLGFNDFDDEGNPVGATTVQDLIISAAVDKLLAGQRDLRNEVREKVGAAITKEIDDSVKVLVQEAFDAPIQRTTTWGEKQGEPTSVRELIREAIERYVTAPKSDDRYSSTKTKNLQELIDSATKDLLDRDFLAYLKQVKADVSVTVHKKALAAAVEFLQK